MRIAIDARKLRDYGIGTYVRNLLRHLSRLDSETEYVLLCRAEDSGVAEELGENFRAICEPARTYSVSEQLRIPLDLRREGIDLFHAPHYVLPPLTPCKSVVTIHDCIHLRFPAVPAEPAGLRLRAVVVVGGDASIEPGADGFGSVEARHPQVLPHP